MLDNIIRQGKLFYSSSPKIQRLAKKLAASSFYGRIVRKKIKRQSLKDAAGPFNLIMETSNFCNAACLMCPHQTMKRPPKIMAPEIFARIIARIKKEKLPLNKVFFSGLGEPLTDPRLLARIKELKKIGVAIRLYTNASLLTPEIFRRLVDLGLEEINISFNGATPQQYRKIMKLNFAKTKKNINALIKIKNQKRSPRPLIQISLVVIKENEPDIKKHLRNWSGKVDSVTVSRAHAWGGKVKISSKLTYPCRSLWHTFNIDSRGNFIICCRDFESRSILGNIQTHSFAEILKSPIIKRFRCRHFKYLLSELPVMCQYCNFPYQDGIEWFLPRSID